MILPEHDPSTEYSEFTYDANGNLKFVRDPRNNTTEYEYDRANRRTKTKPPIITIPSTEPQRQATTAYVGRTRVETDLAEKVTIFENDELGQLVRVTDAHGKQTTYAYDEMGNRITQTDAEGRVTRFEYDKLGRETKRTLPLGAFETKTYGLDGLETHTDFNGATTTFEYDPVTGRLATRDYPSMTDVDFTYFDDGRRHTVTDGRGVTTYGYDERRRLTSLEYPGGTRRLEYEYDNNGFRTLLRARLPGPLVLETHFTPDGNNRLKDVTDPEGRIYGHGYDANGNRLSLKSQVGTLYEVTTDYLHDEQNRLRDLTTTGPGVSVI